LIIADNKGQLDRDSGSALLWRKLATITSMRATPFGVGTLKEGCLILVGFFLGILGESADVRLMLPPIADTLEAMDVESPQRKGLTPCAFCRSMEMEWAVSEYDEAYSVHTSASS